MFFQTTENPTVYLPNDPNLVILRNVSWVGPKSQRPAIWWDLRINVFFLAKWSSQKPSQTMRIYFKTAKPHGFQKLPDHGVNFSKRYPVKIQMKWSGQKKSHHLHLKCPKCDDRRTEQNRQKFGHLVVSCWNFSVLKTSPKILIFQNHKIWNIWEVNRWIWRVLKTRIVSVNSQLIMRLRQPDTEKQTRNVIRFWVETMGTL